MIPTPKRCQHTADHRLDTTRMDSLLKEDGWTLHHQDDTASVWKSPNGRGRSEYICVPRDPSQPDFAARRLHALTRMTYYLSCCDTGTRELLDAQPGPEPDYPEHEKLAKVKDHSQAIGEFLEWATGEQGMSFGSDEPITFDEEETKNPYHAFADKTYFKHANIESILAEYFGIDRDKLEAEKQQMLEALRTAQAKAQP